MVNLLFYMCRFTALVLLYNWYDKQIASIYSHTLMKRRADQMLLLRIIGCTICDHILYKLIYKIVRLLFSNTTISDNTQNRVNFIHKKISLTIYFCSVI